MIGRVHWHTYQWSWYRSMEDRPRRDSESRSATTTLLLENLHGNAANLVATTALPLPPLRSRSRIALSAQSYVKFCNMNLWSSCPALSILLLKLPIPTWYGWLLMTHAWNRMDDKIYFLDLNILRVLRFARWKVNVNSASGLSWLVNPTELV